MNTKYAVELLRNTTVRGGALFFIGGILANAFNYFYRIAMGRMLPPIEFGEVTALVSLLLIFAVPASPLQIVGAKIASQLVASLRLGGLRAFFFRATFMLAGASLVVVALGVLMGSPMAQFLQISSPYALILAWGAVAFLLIASVSRGVLQGLERFSQTAVLVTIEGAVKMGSAILFVAAGWGVAGAVGGLFVSALAAYLISLFFLRDIVVWRSGDEITVRDGHLAREIFLTFFAFLFINILLNADVLLVKHYFPPEDAGIFSAVATLGRIVFLLGTILAGVLLPLVVRAKELGEDVARPLVVIGGISMALAATTAIHFTLFPQFFLQLFFGTAYLAGAPYVGYYSILMIFMSAIFLASYFFMAVGKFHFLIILAVASFGEIMGIVVFHKDVIQVLNVFAEVLGVALFTIAVFLRNRIAHR